MTRILLGGCNGRMGRAVTACVADRCDCEIVAGIDLNTESHAGFPVFANPANCGLDADVLIDFSHPSALSGILEYAKERRLPVVVATTGLSEQQKEELLAAAEYIPVFQSANMSLGVSLLAELARKAAAVLGEDFDVEIVEKHHNQKLDAPSGTALMLADAVKQGLCHETEYVYDRHAVRQKRGKQEIGISAVRGGTIVGEHEIIFAGYNEVITLSHSAQSRELFAAGALSAGIFLAKQSKGVYSMADLVSSI